MPWLQNRSADGARSSWFRARGSVDVLTLRRRRPVWWCVVATAQNLCSTDWIRSRVSSIRWLFWSLSGPMAGLRLQRCAGRCCSCGRGALRPGVMGLRRIRPAIVSWSRLRHICWLRHPSSISSTVCASGCNSGTDPTTCTRPLLSRGRSAS